MASPRTHMRARCVVPHTQTPRACYLRAVKELQWSARASVLFCCTSCNALASLTASKIEEHISSLLLNSLLLVHESHPAASLPQQPSAREHGTSSLGRRHSCLPVSWLQPHVRLQRPGRRPLRAQTRVRLRGPHALFGIGGGARAAPQQVRVMRTGTLAVQVRDTAVAAQVPRIEVHDSNGHTGLRTVLCQLLQLTCTFPETAVTSKAWRGNDLLVCHGGSRTTPCIHPYALVAGGRSGGEGAAAAARPEVHKKGTPSR